MSQEGEEGWEDDEMDDLFSFGVEGTSTAGSSPVLVETPDPSVPEPTRERTGSDDSFLEMLDETKLDISGDVLASAGVVDDAETQEILNWLDQDETETPELKTEPAAGDEKSQDVATEKDAQADKTTQQVDTTATKETAPPPPAPTVVELPPPTPKKPTFKTLEEAVKSPESSIQTIRDLFVEEGMHIDDAIRPDLWSRIVCSKSVASLESSSVADSFVKWKSSADLDSFKDDRSVWIKTESAILAERIVCMSREEATTELSLLLIFHFKGNDAKGMDPLLPPVACTILSSGLPPAAASVVLSNIMPAFMPLLALTQEERSGAATALHSQFYLLACYHLPLLVFHLDRYAPGWHWPKQLTKENDEAAWRNTEKHGIVPQSWLISHLAGECKGTFMNPKWLLSLWDLILTSSNNSLRFFLSLAVLEKHSDTLLMITGDKLILELNRIMEFKEGTTVEGFSIESEEETTSDEAVDWVQEWCNRARDLWESTPRSVVVRLRKAEDAAVSQALTERQRKAEEKMQAKLEEEARLHKEAMEAEREKRADEGRRRLNRARLLAYYRQFNPGKEGNIDKIMETYGDRLEVLDGRLKAKYGQGFNPALKPALAVQTNKFLSSMNQGLTNQRKRISTALQQKENDIEVTKRNQVAVKVSSNEVLPIICWAKESDPLKKAAHRPSDALKFYLVDSRPEETAQEQGGFPTALKMSPEDLLDPDRMKAQEEIFESLRGAAHIVVMGEGFSAVPKLYGQKLNPSLTRLIKEDDSRTSLCALFFVKRGFPFVSVLEGGFCGAHAWLSREGPKKSLYVNSVLIDYSGDGSLFGELEKAYREQKEFANASTGAKTQMALQGLFDKSMTSVVRNKTRLENLAANMETTESRFTKFFKAEEAPKRESAKSAADGSRFRINLSANRVGIAEALKSVSPTKPTPTKVAQPPTGSNSTPKPPTAPVEQPKVTKTQVKDAEKKTRFPTIGTSTFGGIGQALKMKTTEASAREPAQGGQASRFATFGASLNNSIKKTAQNAKQQAKQQDIPNVLKRNPFARFGGKEQVQSRFGMAQMRNPLARQRATQEEQEESEIDFGDASTTASNLSLTEEPMQQIGLTES